MDKITRITNNYRDNIEPDIARSQNGKFALVSEKELIKIFISSGDAEIFALARGLKVGEFCIQEIRPRIERFGYQGVRL